jgi:hypothetical protein
MSLRGFFLCDVPTPEGLEWLGFRPRLRTLGREKYSRVYRLHGDGADADSREGHEAEAFVPIQLIDLAIPRPN